MSYNIRLIKYGTDLQLEMYKTKLGGKKVYLFVDE